MASAVDMALFLPVGYMHDHWGRKYSGVSCLLLLSVAILLIPLSSGYMSFLAIAGFAGFANGLGTGINMTLGTDLAPASGRGEFIGVWRLFGDVGAAAGPLAIGALAGIASLGTVCFLIASVGLFGTLVMAFAVKETLASSNSSR
jgi:MFS family permease